MESSPQHYLALTLRFGEKFFYIFESRDKTKFHYSFFSVCFFSWFFAPFCAKVCFCAANTVPFFPANSILFVYTFVVQKKAHTTKRTDNAHYWIVEHVFTYTAHETKHFFSDQPWVTHTHQEKTKKAQRTCDEHIAKNLKVLKRITDKF